MKLSTSDNVYSRNQRLLALYRAGKSRTEIATELNMSLGLVGTLIHTARQWLGPEAVPYSTVTRSLHERPFWLRVGRLWRGGKNAAEIGIAMVNDPTRGTTLVQQARSHIGRDKVPIKAPTSTASFARRQAAIAAGPVTMTSMGRHFERRAGNEFIFRNENTQEEIWVADPKGIVWRTTKLVFKEVLGPLAARVG